MLGTVTDWTKLDPNVGSTTPSPPDLFGGEIFGEELIDVYNSETTIVANAGDMSSEQIPLLLPVPENTMSASSNAAVVQPAFGTESVGYGLGSSSFNELAALLQPNGAPTATASGPSPLVHVAMTATSDNNDIPAPASMPKKETKKRTANTTPEPEAPTVKKARAAGQTVVAVLVTEARMPFVLPTGHGIKVGPQSVMKAPNVGQVRVGKGNAPKQLEITVTRKAASGVVMPTMVTSSDPPAIVTPPVVASVLSRTTNNEEAAPKVPVMSAPTSAIVRTERSMTEADFAKAAVENLMLNVSSQVRSNKKDGSSKEVDTSAAHIKTLTSTNWIAACAGPNGSPAVNGAPKVAAEAKANRTTRRSLNLTPDERAKKNRDRNREHARNTRLRKKAYLEELTRTLTHMVAQREASEVEKRHAAQRDVEIREVRFRVMEEFLKLRGRNEADEAKWSAILEDGFSLSLPLTGYRTMAETSSSSKARVYGRRPVEQTLTGASEVMTDSACFSSFLQTLGDETVVGSIGSGTVTTFLYHCEPKNFLMDGCSSVLSFTANSVGAIGKGAPYELTLKGLMVAKFCPESNKMMSAELSFNSDMVVEQLRELVISCQAVPPPVNDTSVSGVAKKAAQLAVTSDAVALLESLQMPHLEALHPVSSKNTAQPLEDLTVPQSSNKENFKDIAGKVSVPQPSGAKKRGPGATAGLTSVAGDEFVLDSVEKLAQSSNES